MQKIFTLPNGFSMNNMGLPILDCQAMYSSAKHEIYNIQVLTGGFSFRVASIKHYHVYCCYEEPGLTQDEAGQEHCQWFDHTYLVLGICQSTREVICLNGCLNYIQQLSI